jgi:hypothetical protein
MTPNEKSTTYRPLVRKTAPLVLVHPGRVASTSADESGRVYGRVLSGNKDRNLRRTRPTKKNADESRDEFSKNHADECCGRVGKRLYNPIKVTMFLPPDCSDLGEIDWS